LRAGGDGGPGHDSTSAIAFSSIHAISSALSSSTPPTIELHFPFRAVGRELPLVSQKIAQPLDPERALGEALRTRRGEQRADVTLGRKQRTSRPPTVSEQSWIQTRRLVDEKASSAPICCELVEIIEAQ
jgi:hypothetical protein